MTFNKKEFDQETQRIVDKIKRLNRRSDQGIAILQRLRQQERWAKEIAEKVGHTLTM